MKFKFYIIGIFTILLSSFCYAQEEARPIEVNGDQVEYFPKEKKVIGTGSVSIDYEDAMLTCNRVTVYTDTKDVEAEGGVVLKTPFGELKGERIKYNFNTKKGEILKAKLHSGDWYTKGEKIELYSDSSYRIENGYITSCDLEEPHYKISSKSVLIYPDNKVVAKDVVFKIGNVPMAYLPRYNYSLETDWPTFNIVPGKKKKWGVFALTTYRYEMDEDNKFTLRLDERENWGFAEGFDYKYTFDNFGDGILKTYYTHQRDRDRNHVILAEEERYRVQLRHRFRISENIDAFLEYHKLSDDEMTKDFFYREEYDRESSPETYFYLLNTQPEYSLSFLTQKRVNRFQTVVERLPELRFDLKDQGLFGSPVYFKTDTSFSNLNKKTGSSSTDNDTVRLDAYNKLTSSLRFADFLNLSPFIGARNTFYSKDTDGDEDEIRASFYTGIDVSTKFFKTYDVSGKLLGVDFNKLHHIITPTIEYKYIHKPSISSSNLQQFDDIDEVARKNTFSLGLENKLQTRRLCDGSLKTVNLGSILLKGDYLYKEENGSRFSDVKVDLELTPFSWVRIESDTKYDPATRDFQTWNTDLYVDKEEWRLGFGSRYWQNTEHELTSELFYKLNNEWSFRLFGRYDLKEVDSSGNKIINRFDAKELTIIKDLHCWLAEASLDIDKDGGTSFWFALRLKASPKMPFTFSDYYAYPKQ